MKIEQAKFIADLFDVYEKALEEDLSHTRAYKKVNDEFINFIKDKDKDNMTDEDRFELEFHKSNRDLFKGYLVTNTAKITELTKIFNGIDTIWP